MAAHSSCFVLLPPSSVARHCPFSLLPSTSGLLTSWVPTELLCLVAHLLSPHKEAGALTPNSAQPDAQASLSTPLSPADKGLRLPAQPPQEQAKQVSTPSKAEADPSLHCPKRHSQTLAAAPPKQERYPLAKAAGRRSPPAAFASPDLARVGMAEPGLCNVVKPCVWLLGHRVQHELW